MTIVDRFSTAAECVALLSTTVWALHSIAVNWPRDAHFWCRLLIGALFRTVILAFGLTLVSQSTLLAGGLNWLATHPEDGLLIVFAFLFVHVLYGGFGYFCQRVKLTDSSAVQPMQPMAAVTEEDERTTAAHESGHALVCCASGRIPKTVQYIEENSAEPGILAQCQYRRTRRLATKDQLEWEMLIVLAGRVAEFALTGEMTIGCVSDLEKWQGAAMEYLASGFGSTHFFHPPTNALEAAQNLEALNQLRDSQTGALRKFFDVNRQSLDSLAALFQQTRKLTKEELKPFATQLQIPSGFPSAIRSKS